MEAASRFDSRTGRHKYLLLGKSCFCFVLDTRKLFVLNIIYWETQCSFFDLGEVLPYSYPMILVYVQIYRLDYITLVIPNPIFKKAIILKLA